MQSGLLLESLKRHLLHHHVFQGLVVDVALHIDHGIHHLHSLNHLSEHRVAAVQPRGSTFLLDDEELRTVRIWS